MEYSWLPMSQRGGLLMLLRAVATLSHHSAGTDTHDARASTYAEMGIKVLKAEAGAHLAPLPGSCEGMHTCEVCDTSM